MAPTKREHARSQVQGLVKTGKSVRDIARLLKMSPTTVSKWKNQTDGSVSDAKRSGRPSKASPQTERKIREWVKDKVGVETRAVAKRLNFSEYYRSINKNISHITISRHCGSQDWSRRSYVPRIKPMLSEKKISNRVKFCESLPKEGYTDARILRAHILFTDESPVELHSIPNRQNARIRTADPSSIKPMQVPKFGVKIMVAGGISRYGKTQLVIVNEKKTVNGEYYCAHILPAYSKVLRDITKFPKQHIAFLMQDGARAHTAKSTLDTIKNSGIKVWTDWPGNSPDLNPIEHLWSRLQESVFRTPRPRNRNECWKIVMDVIKMEPDADPLRVTTYEIGENNTLSEEGNLCHLEVTGLMTECVDHSCDLKSEIKVEDTPVPINFPVVKSEFDEGSFDVDRVQQKQKVEASSEKDGVLTESSGHYIATYELQLEPVINHLKHRNNWINHLHLIRRDRIPKVMLHYRPNGKRSLSHPKKRWIENCEIVKTIWPNT
ncbi:hypothetical protein ANN_27745 [Periplaneta americana]|uniref:Tc1-like transposase DDE domain-containing protein n=1 Tax=Periplaneta americana TaxID=6978 RepID=A0ABQ8RVG6_PERAM|nr:hypothetical protein ANN_27745 [Periplaneta americana]